MKVAALSGGVGGAKLLVGLQRVAGRGLTAIVNTADDSIIYGVHVAPDVDIVTYWLAGLADTDRGWGLRGDTWHVVDALHKLGAESWFRLGDRDFATCIFRTEQMWEGASLSAVTANIAATLGVRARVLPMSDDRVRTTIETVDGRTLAFQEYFVKEEQAPAVARVDVVGLSSARPSPGVIESIELADIVVVCPSNPVVSIAPVIGIAGVREALRAHPMVVAVSPIVRGAPLRGPADKLLAAEGGDVSASGVSGLYDDFCNVFVVDSSDETEVPIIQSRGMRAVATPTIMRDPQSSERLAREVVGFVA